MSTIKDKDAKQQVRLPQFELEQYKRQPHSLWQSFGFAFSGFKTVFQNERNFRIHCGIAVLAIIFSAVLSISAAEWGVILGFIGLVLFAELTNSAVEYFVDLLTEGRYHPKAKVIKDSMAAAVLVCAITAAIAGCIIFVSKLVALPFFI